MRKIPYLALGALAGLGLAIGYCSVGPDHPPAATYRSAVPQRQRTRPEAPPADSHLPEGSPQDAPHRNPIFEEDTNEDPLTGYEIIVSNPTFTGGLHGWERGIPPEKARPGNVGHSPYLGGSLHLTLAPPVSLAAYEAAKAKAASEFPELGQCQLEEMVGERRPARERPAHRRAREGRCHRGHVSRERIVPSVQHAHHHRRRGVPGQRLG